MAQGAKRPAAPTAGVTRREGSDTSTLAFDVDVVTYVQGGGVSWDDSDEKRHVKRIDAVTPFRPSSVRGHLRFWWRATHGCTAGSLEEMRAREGRLWGLASEPSKVTVKVTGPTQRPQTIELFQGHQGNSRKWNPRVASRDLESISYGGLGIQPKGGLVTQPSPGILTREFGGVRVELRYPSEFAEEVRDSVVAWLLFGGIGGRTRRGFGSLRTNTEALRTSLNVERFLGRFSATQTLRLVPSLHGARYQTVGMNGNNALDAWKRSIGKLRDFRQKGGIARTERVPTPGRSWWPEPDQIRRITRKHDSRHVPDAGFGVTKFPRAAFGLPIIFHFKDSRTGDPDDTTLKPREFERMASPLVVKAVCESNAVRALALVLRVPGRESVELALTGTQVPSGAATVDPSLTASEAACIRPLQGQSQGQSDPLAAFLQFFAR